MPETLRGGAEAASAVQAETSTNNQRFIAMMRCLSGARGPAGEAALWGGRPVPRDRPRPVEAGPAGE